MTTDQPSYAFDNAWVEARRRLTLLEELYDPLTIQSLECVGIKPGWRCLEVGPGAGSIAGWLCSRVGPSGRVVAVDLDTRFVDELAATEDNLEVQRHDVVADGIPGGEYDLIHARMVLIHLPSRQQVLEAMVASLRPGGWLVIEDGDAFPITALATGAYAELWRVLTVVFESVGMHPTWARELPAIFDRLELEEVDVDCHAGMFRGGAGAFSEVMNISITQIRPLMLAAGMTEAQLDSVAPLLADPTRWFPMWGMSCVRGRAPAG
jgi:SAM-dependent methyltransferase